LRDLLECLGSSVKELGLFFMIITVAMVLFAAAGFYAEKDDQPEEFSSIPGAQRLVRS